MKKDRNVENFQELEQNVEKAIDKVKPKYYKNYFEYAYNKKNKTIRMRNTRKIKNYKL